MADPKNSQNISFQNLAEYNSLKIIDKENFAFLVDKGILNYISYVENLDFEFIRVVDTKIYRKKINFSSIKISDDKMRIEFHIKSFESKDFIVSIQDDYIIVKVKHEDRIESKYPDHTIAREVVRKYPLPKKCNRDKIKAKFDNGKLIVTAPFLKYSYNRVIFKECSNEEQLELNPSISNFGEILYKDEDIAENPAQTVMCENSIKKLDTQERENVIRQNDLFLNIDETRQTVTAVVEQNKMEEMNSTVIENFGRKIKIEMVENLIAEDTATTESDKLVQEMITSKIRNCKENENCKLLQIAGYLGLQIEKFKDISTVQDDNKIKDTLLMQENNITQEQGHCLDLNNASVTKGVLETNLSELEANKESFDASVQRVFCQNTSDLKNLVVEEKDNELENERKLLDVAVVKENIFGIEDDNKKLEQEPSVELNYINKGKKRKSYCSK